MTRTFSASTDWVEREVRGERLLVPTGSAAMEHESFFALNEVASRIYEMAADGADEAAITDALAAEYDAGAAEISADVEQTLHNLVSLGALNPVGDA